MRALNLINKQSRGVKNLILWFSYPIFFIYIADSTLSYIFPIAVENVVQSNTIMGLILSASSFVGLICDFLFPQLFKNRTWRFYLVNGILISLLFPIFLNLGSTFLLIPFFLIASIVWGLYFELLLFSEQTFVVDTDDKDSFVKDWGTLYFFYQITAILGPILGSILLKELAVISSITLIIIQLTSLLFAFVLILKIPYKESRNKEAKSRIKQTLHILKEAKSWELLSYRVWPVILMGTSVTFISATFWTIGGLLGQTLNLGYEMDWVVIVVFNIPLMLGSFALTKLKIINFKKRISQISLLLSSISLSSLILFKDNSVMILVIVILSSLLLSVAHPLNEAVYSDLLERMGKGKEYLIGLAKSNTSIAYILAPVIVGFLSDNTDYITTFSIVGIIFILISILLLIFTPRKLKLPQKELKELN